MARNSHPGTLKRRDLVISRPVLPLPEDFQYPESQQGRVRSLAEIFQDPPTELLMAVIRGDKDFALLFSILSRQGLIDPNNLERTIVESFQIARADEDLFFPNTRLRIEKSGLGHLAPHQPEGAPTSGLSLTPAARHAMGESFLPGNGAPFLKVAGPVLKGVHPAMAPAILLGTVSCRVIGASEPAITSA